MSSTTDDEASVSSSTSTGSSRFLPRIFLRVDSSGSIPKYDATNRMLSPSSLPSPAESAKRPNPKPPTIQRWDSDSSDGAKQREEDNMKRLVQMAKQQQSLKSAWFAASAGGQCGGGGGVSILPPPPLRRSRSHSRRLSSVNAVDNISVDSSLSSRSDGPVDVDNVPREDDHEEVSIEATPLVRVKSFLQSILPASTPNTACSKSVSVSSEVDSGAETRKISNVTDVERGRESGRDENHHPTKRWTFHQLIVAALLVLLGIAILSAVVSVAVTQSKQAGGDGTPVEGRIPDGTTIAPTITMAPSTFMQLTSVPSMLPSSSPSLGPTVMPSRVPSSAPSFSPTQSTAPSATPSQAPTTIFATSSFDSLMKMSGLQLDEQYGYTVAVSGDGSVIAVGAPNFSLGQQEKTGRVQVFERVSMGWQVRGDVLFGRNEVDQLGYAISLSDDGSRLAISEPGLDGPAGDRSGNVRVLDYSDTEWTLVGNEIHGEAVADLFGLSLSLSGNGQRLAVGSPYHDSDDHVNLSGRVRVFELYENTWQPLGDALDGAISLDLFGWSIDLSFDGSVVAIGAPRNTEHGGYVRSFQYTANSWKQVGSDIINDIGVIQTDDRFGMAVSLSADGMRVAIGSPWKNYSLQSPHVRKSGLAAVYQRAEDDWTLMGNTFAGLTTNHRLGWSICLRDDFLTIGIPGDNKVSFHRWTGLSWDTVQSPLQGGVQQDQVDFGHAVAMSSNGQFVVVGATEASQGGTGYVQVFGRRDPP